MGRLRQQSPGALLLHHPSRKAATRRRRKELAGPDRSGGQGAALRLRGDAMGWIDRVMNLVRHKELDRDLEEEMRFHLDARIRDNRKAGMPADEARQDAIRRFGNQGLAKELTREKDTF